jgi:hypothetical protein
MADNLFFIPGLIKAIPQGEPIQKEGSDPLVRYDPNLNSTERAERARKFRYKQVVTQEAFKSGGWQYNTVNPKAIPVKHATGVIIYIDPPANQEVVKKVEDQKVVDTPVIEVVDQVVDQEPAQEERTVKRRGRRPASLDTTTE